MPSSNIEALRSITTEITPLYWLYWGFTSLQRYFSHIVTWKQEITNLWKFKRRGGESNPSPLAPQAKSLTPRPTLLLHHYTIRKKTIHSILYFYVFGLGNFHGLRCFNNISVITRLEIRRYPISEIVVAGPGFEPRTRLAPQTKTAFPLNRCYWHFFFL